jgi:CRISPR/Cas system-associated endonuclease Cas3-HD
MNINGRIHTGMSHNHKKNAQGKIKSNSVMKTWRRRLEVKHGLQYFLLRQKTPPVMKNTAKAAIMIYK